MDDGYPSVPGSQNGARANLVAIITSPLGFFALSLLIVEGFLTIVLIFSGLNQESKHLGMLIGAGLFIFIELGVLFLVWCKPKNLTFEAKAHLQQQQLDKKNWGTSDTPETKKTVESEASPVTPTT